MTDRWRMIENYTKPKPCLGCGSTPTSDLWGPWCIKCNVPRIERIGSTLVRLDYTLRALSENK